MKATTTIKSRLRASLFTLGITSASLLSAQTVFTVEAEDPFEMQYGQIAELPTFSGGKGLVEQTAGRKSQASYYLEVDEEGTYDLVIYYVTMQERYLSVQIGSQIPTILYFDELTGGWDGTPGEVEGVERPGIATKTIQVYLEAGENEMTVAAYEGFSPSTNFYNSAAPNIDKYEVRVSATQIAKPANLGAPVIREAENADSFSGTAGVSTEPRTTFSGQSGAGTGSSGTMTFTNIQVPETGAYVMKIHYATMQTRWMYVKANCAPKTYHEFSEHTVSWGDKESEDPNKPTVYQKIVQLYLTQGSNTIILGSHEGESSEHADSPNVDFIEIYKVNAEMEDPGCEKIAKVFDYTDIAVAITPANTGGEIKHLTDNDEYTLYTLPGVKSTEVIAELPYPIMLTGYAWASSNSTEDWSVEYSVDGTTWAAVSSNNSTTESNLSTYDTDHSFDTPNAAKYYKLKVSGSADVEVGEWQLYGIPYLSADKQFPDDLLDGSGYMQASNDGFNRDGDWHEVFENTIDKLAATKYTVVDEKTFWLLYELSESETAKSYSISIPYTTSYMNRNPKKWKLSGYNSEVGDWVELDSRENMIFPVTASTYQFNIKEPVACDAYRLEVLQNNGASDVHLSQWQLFKDYTLPVGVGSAQADENNTIAAYGTKGSIVLFSALTDAAAYAVYNMTGQKIATGTCEAGTTEIAVNTAGLYIVVAHNKAIKVMVK